MTLSYVQCPTFYLQGAGVLVGATSITLTSLTDIYGNVLTMSSFGSKGYITFEPDTQNEEAAIFTGITANANGTYTLTGISTALAQTPYTETSGLIRAHSGGSKVVVTDTADFWSGFTNKSNNEVITGEWSTTFTPTNANDLATKTYVDNVAVAGAPNASTTVKGIVQEATQAQVLAKTASGSTGAELYINPATISSTLLSDYKVDTGSANAYAIAPAPAITAYTTGQIFSFKAVNANTTASTLNVNGLGTKAIVNSAGGALVANDITAGMMVTVEYNGTSMVMVNPVANTPTVAPISYSANIQVFASSGTWTMPANAKKIFVQCWGAGGSGGAGDASHTYTGGGGGGGGYSETFFNATDLSSPVTVTVGPTTTGNATTGANTTFGSYLTAYGGVGGFSANNSNGGGAGGASLLGFGTSVYAGGVGGTSAGAGTQSIFGGAGGGGGSAVSVAGGSGGAAFFGGAGGGGGGDNSTNASGGASKAGYGGSGGAGGSQTGTVNGAAGSVPGGGGGGGGFVSSNGGNGAAGQCVVTTFF